METLLLLPEKATASAPANVTTKPEKQEQASNVSANQTGAEPYSHKITEEEFLAVLEANHGLYAPTARAIERNYGVRFTRQSVRERAQKYRDLNPDQRAKIIELAKSTVYDAIEQDRDMKLKFKASSFLLTKLNFGKYNNLFND